MSPLVSGWFGSRFTQLHPWLQSLHLHGGTLSGTVKLDYAGGFVGWVGKRIGVKLGLPGVSGQYPLTVNIAHTETQLIWSRAFNQVNTMTSLFTPYGTYPEGYWQEKTGATELILGVEIIDGGWHWQQRSMSMYGKALPRCLSPSATAYKRIQNGAYEFSVSLKLPFLGQFVSYSGLLYLRDED